MQKKIQLFACAVALLFLTTGCGGGALKVAPHYTATKKGPLGGVQSATISLRVTDGRVADERTEIGRIYGTFGGVKRKIESVPPVTDVIRDTLKSELEVNGHRVVYASQNLPTHMDVVLKRFFFEGKPKMWDAEVSVNTIAELQVMGTGINAPPITVSATYLKSRQLVSRGDIVLIINDGLAEFARTISFDPRVEEALNRAAGAAPTQK